MKIRQISEGVLNEGGLARVLSHFHNRNFAILTAFRASFSYAENLQRNKMLEAELRAVRAGGIKLIGHWAEAPDGVEFSDADPSQLTDVTEESYFVPQSTLDDGAFFSFILGLIRKFEQDAAVFKNSDGVHLLNKDGELFKIGSTLSVAKIAQAYSTIGDRTFIFEGTMGPSCNAHRQLLSRRGIDWVRD